MKVEELQRVLNEEEHRFNSLKYSRVMECRAFNYSGLKQGDGLSPLLFNIALDKVIRSSNFRIATTFRIRRRH